MMAPTGRRTLHGEACEQHKRCRCAPLAPFLGLDFRGVLGDALRDERGFAHRLSHVYRTSPEGERDIVFVPNWFTNCETIPELPSVQRWIEAMASLGRLILFDQPGTGASDPVTLGALPTLEQWADSITAVLDDLGSSQAVLLASVGSLPTSALFAAAYPARTTALVVFEAYAEPIVENVYGTSSAEEAVAALASMWGTGEYQHVVNPDMPWNEEIRAAWARHERLAASPAILALMLPLTFEVDVRAVLPTVRVPTVVIQHSNNALIPSERGRYVADQIPGAKYVEVPGRNAYHFVEPWQASFQEMAQFLTGRQADVVDDRVLATVLFTDIVDSTRRVAEIGDRPFIPLSRCPPLGGSLRLSIS
jgi:pimeloyl-ACP methyl ester carboxylesterase